MMNGSKYKWDKPIQKAVAGVQNDEDTARELQEIGGRNDWRYASSYVS